MQDHRDRRNRRRFIPVGTYPQKMKLANRIKSVKEEVATLKRKRSFFITEATRKKLERERFLAVLDQTKGAWSEESHPELRTAKNIDRYVRDKRQPSSRTIRNTTRFQN